MISALSIATSGMLAADDRLQASASNVANMLDAGPLDDGTGASGTYRPLRVEQSEAPGGGVAVRVQARESSLAADAPDDPATNAEGLVAFPDVDLVRESVDQAGARLEFAANLAVVQAGSQLATKLLDAVA
ncbi:flagellar basal body rod protein FlgC [Labrys wisconsinensis]|uniref:Flagellar basal-body rod protein FlgC n=1 Tax=Labrys wisconsinensis TaxID=425677 RepID=A0ABU0JL61_9HYPH|nr:flagellar biosynthesis protein FlgC [Labrys wisconsinensis]MDQ0475030.1 flagellar basal-body rod protein FlgC [Labrys wisconsinensis]